MKEKLEIGKKLRRYEEKDDPQLREMLLEEGLNDDNMVYGDRDKDTFVIEDNGIIKAFFTIKREHDFPSLQHFCSVREYRTPALARELVKSFAQTIRMNGFKKALVHATNERTKTFIEYFWKAKPYSIKDGRNWYLVEV